MTIDTTVFGMDERLYFKQLLSGVDFAVNDSLASQMRNFSYIIGDAKTREVVLVDPAHDPATLLAIVDDAELKLSGVLITHYHSDHLGGSMMGLDVAGVANLLEVVEVPVHVQKDEVEYIVKTSGLSPEALTTHTSGDKVTVGEIDIELIHTPGHTPGSQCFLVQDRLVSGDTLFLDGCGRTDLPGGDAEQLYESLTQKLAKVGDQAVLFPGHDYGSASSQVLGETRKTNQVFRPNNAADWLAAFG